MLPSRQTSSFNFLGPSLLYCEFLVGFRTNILDRTLLVDKVMGLPQGVWDLVPVCCGHGLGTPFISIRYSLLVNK